MVRFTEETRIFYTFVLIISLILDVLCILAAFHNIIRYLCRPRKNRMLINIFYLFIIMALLAKILLIVYLLWIDKDEDFLRVGNAKLEEFLFIDSALEDCLCIVFVIMLYQLTLAIQQMFGSINEN